MANEQDELRAFLAERLLAFNPSIDTDPGSAADTDIIAPILNRLAPDPFDTPILEFFRARLKSEFPDLILQAGEPLDDVMKPMRAMIEPYRRQITSVKNNQSVADPKVLNEDEADRLLKNYFENRRQGGFSTGTTRLFFTNPRAASIAPTNAVFTGSGLRFFPVEFQSISAETMLFNLSGSLYYFDIVVRSENQGEDYNIDPGQIIGIENFPAVVKATNLVRFRDGARRETTEEFFSRVEGTLGEKSLVVPRGIRARLFKLFDVIQTIGVIGHGDPEMMRDIITGSPSGVFAFGNLTASTSLSRLILSGSSFTDGLGSTNFVAAGVEVGDTASHIDLSLGVIKDYEVVEIITPFQLSVSPSPPNIITPAPFWFRSKNRGRIYLSDIPGGIVDPTTPNGEITVENRQVHIGGQADVFIRAGTPQESAIDIAAVRDGDPLHFGIDLESFGADAMQFVQVTEKIENYATTETSQGPGPGFAEILIQVVETSDDTTPWSPAITDIGRYLELLGPDDYGLFQIVDILEDSVVGGEIVRRVKINLFDEHTQGNGITISDRSSVFDLAFRIVDTVEVTPRVRDRADPVVDFNGDGDGIGGRIGDSIVIETGTDAGIYSIRRILTSVGNHDTLVLDRALTDSVTPTGAGDGTGLRYRLDDDLTVDLVKPRILKIPLGVIFPGGDLQTVAASAIVFSTDTNFLLAGVEAGDTLSITEGEDIGEFDIVEVFTDSLRLATAPESTAFNLDFEIYRQFSGVERPLVRVKSVELLDSSNQPTGITLPYGDVVDARVLGAFANRSQGNIVESFKGAVISGSPLITFEDLSVNFVAKGVVVGSRLEILEGNNLNEYEIAEVAPGDNVNQLVIIGTDDDGLDFSEEEADLHYRVGLPSSGVVRLYFIDPTSATVATGIGGGRLEFQDRNQAVKFRFSEVEGRVLIPAPASTSTDEPRDLRVARSYTVGGGNFESIVEITDGENPDAYDSEIVEGDLLEVFEPIPFRTSSGDTFAEVGIFGTPAGLRTIAGSNRVSVPANSRIDFTQMGDLAGQRLHINEGPDTGKYVVRRVINSKVLELDAVMTTSTAPIRGYEAFVPYDATLVEDSGSVYLVDETDVGQLGPVGDFITIFEGDSPDVEGTFEILSREIVDNRVELDGFDASNIGGAFSWVSTGSDTPDVTLEQPFSIYETVPTQLEIVQVATKASEVTALGTGDIPGPGPLYVLQGEAGDFDDVVRGDRLEIFYGPNEGVYPVLSATTDAVTVYSEQPFSSAEVGVRYRIWGGLHGPRRMLTVGNFEGESGLLQPGLLIPYRIRRAAEFRISSTEMSEQVENGLYYVDVQVESLGPGDDRNLSEGDRLVVTRGLRVDGYTYVVENEVLSFSPYEEVSIVFDRRFLPVGNTDLPENQTEVNGRNLRVVYEHSPTTRIVNDFLHSPTDRTVVASIIARHFLPSYVYSTLSYQGGSSSAVVGPEIERFINNLSTIDRLEVSDLENFVQRRGATFIVHPIKLVAVTHGLDRKLVAERSGNFLGGPDVPFNGTSRISAYFAVLDGGLTVERL